MIQDTTTQNLYQRLQVHLKHAHRRINVHTHTYDGISTFIYQMNPQSFSRTILAQKIFSEGTMQRDWTRNNEVEKQAFLLYINERFKKSVFDDDGVLLFVHIAWDHGCDTLTVTTDRYKTGNERDRIYYTDHKRQAIG